tara:strand:- start:408 stop:926 length:519 start_codon:yes stop_codon:yes gene_type:complete
MPFDIITVTPTLTTGAYADNEVLFTSTEIKLPHNKCQLVSLSAIFTDTDTTATVEQNNREIIVMFFKENTHQLGTIGDGAPSITGAQIATNVSLGAVRLVNSTGSGEASLGVPSIFGGQAPNDRSAASSSLPKLILAEGSTKNTCYIQGLYEVGGADTYEASDLVITIGVKY